MRSTTIASFWIALASFVSTSPWAEAQLVGEQIVGDAPAVAGGRGLPRVLVTGRTFYVFYDTPSQPHAELRVAVSHDAGRTWLPDQTLGQVTATFLHAEADGPFALVAFGVNQGGMDPEMYVAATRDRGKTWTCTQFLDIDGFARVWAPRVVIDGPSMYVFWSVDDLQERVDQLQVSADGGQTWLPSPRASVPVNVGYQGGADARGDLLVAVNDHWLYRSYDRGVTWVNRRSLPRVDGIANSNVSGDIWIGTGDELLAMVVTYVGEGAYTVTNVDVSVDGGASWVRATAGERAPKLTRSADRVIVTSSTDDPNTDGTYSYLAASSDGGLTFPPGFRIARTAANRFCKRAKTYHGDFDGAILAVYHEECEPNLSQLFASSSLADDYRWTAPYPIRYAEPTLLYEDDVDFDHDATSGCAAVVWVETRNEETRVWMNGGAMSGVDPLACRTGNVDSTLGTPDDVLFLNGSAGAGPERAVVVEEGDAIELSLERPASESGETEELEYAVFFWYATPSDFTTRILPKQVGDLCMPLPPLPRSGVPGPAKRLNTLGFVDKIGPSTHPSAPGPGILLATPSSGPRRTLFVQGLVRNAACPNGTVAVTNGLLLVVD